MKVARELNIVVSQHAKIANMNCSEHFRLLYITSGCCPKPIASIQVRGEEELAAIKSAALEVTDSDSDRFVLAPVWRCLRPAMEVTVTR